MASRESHERSVFPTPPATSKFIGRGLGRAADTCKLPIAQALTLEACGWRLLRLSWETGRCPHGAQENLPANHWLGQESWQCSLAKCGSFLMSLSAVAAVSSPPNRQTCGPGSTRSAPIACVSSTHQAVISPPHLGAQAHRCKSSSSKRPNVREALARCICLRPPSSKCVAPPARQRHREPGKSNAPPEGNRIACPQEEHECLSVCGVSHFQASRREI
jgi:hypothetical protein